MPQQLRPWLHSAAMRLGTACNAPGFNAEQAATSPPRLTSCGGRPHCLIVGGGTQHLAQRFHKHRLAGAGLACNGYSRSQQMTTHALVCKLATGLTQNGPWQLLLNPENTQHSRSSLLVPPLACDGCEARRQVEPLLLDQRKVTDVQRGEVGQCCAGRCCRWGNLCRRGCCRRCRRRWRHSRRHHCCRRMPAATAAEPRRADRSVPACQADRQPAQQGFRSPTSGVEGENRGCSRRTSELHGWQSAADGCTLAAGARRSAQSCATAAVQPKAAQGGSHEPVKTGD